MFRTVVRPRSHGFSAGGTLGALLVDFQSRSSATSSAAAHIKTAVDGPGPLESCPPSGGVSKVFRRVSSWVLGSGPRQVPERQVRDSFCRFVLLFSAFFALHGLSQVSSPARSCFPGCSRSREAHPGHARSWEWSARSVAGPHKFLEPYGGLSFVLSVLLRCVRSLFVTGLMKFISPFSVSSCASTGTPASPSSRSLGALSCDGVLVVIPWARCLDSFSSARAVGPSSDRCCGAGCAVVWLCLSTGTVPIPPSSS